MHSNLSIKSTEEPFYLRQLLDGNFMFAIIYLLKKML